MKRRNSRTLAEKVALVTGGGSGLGEPAAIELAGQGAEIFIDGAQSLFQG